MKNKNVRPWLEEINNYTRTEVTDNIVDVEYRAIVIKSRAQAWPAT